MGEKGKEEGIKGCRNRINTLTPCRGRQVALSCFCKDAFFSSQEDMEEESVLFSQSL